MASGNRRHEPSPEFPKDCIQSLAGTWWTQAPDREVRRGQLLWAHVPFVGFRPYELIPESRLAPTDHSRAIFRLEPWSQSRQQPVTQLPVAALPQNPGESYFVYRGKCRPVLVVGTGGREVEPDLTRGSAKWQSSRTLLVAPYFSLEADGTRGGWNEELVRRIRHCEYPQYFWDHLPVNAYGGPSILRLDQIQPIGSNHEAYSHTPFRLSPEAIEILDAWLAWLFLDRIEAEGMLELARSGLPGFE
jgi:hypothetical protein